MRDTIAEYYEAVHEHDWVKLASTLAEGVVRIGVLSEYEDDVAQGKQAYMRFCVSIIESLEYHTMEIKEIFYSGDRRYACAETVETIQLPGSNRIKLHCLKLHELDEGGLIVKIDQYRKSSPVATPTTISVGTVMADL
jgi:SnoaL-like domain